MKKKVTVISACLVLFVAWLFGVIYTNVRAERPVVKKYYMNEMFRMKMIISGARQYLKRIFGNRSGI